MPAVSVPDGASERAVDAGGKAGAAAPVAERALRPYEPTRRIEPRRRGRQPIAACGTRGRGADPDLTRAGRPRPLHARENDRTHVDHVNRRPLALIAAVVMMEATRLSSVIVESRPPAVGGLAMAMSCQRQRTGIRASRSGILAW